MRLLLLVTLVALASIGIGDAKPIRLSALKRVRRILFLGDSITYAGGYVDAVDAYLRRFNPDDQIEIIDVGLPSETVSGLTEPGHAESMFPRPGLHERLARALMQAKPDLVVAGYGVNDGIYYPFSQDRFDAFKSGILRLRQAVNRTGARLWLLTPFPFDPQPIKSALLPEGRESYPSGRPFEGYDAVLTLYAKWLTDQRRHGWNVVDIHSRLNEFLANRRKSEPTLTLADDGVHMKEIGHRIVARELLTAWGAPPMTLPTLNLSRADSVVAKFQQLIHDRQRLLCAAWLTAIGHKRPGIAPGLPLLQAKSLADAMEQQISSLVPMLPPVFPGTVSDYHGFDRYNFVVDGLQAVVVAPQALSSPGKRPWIWRAEFFDHRPELDLALLERGFHLAYIEVGNTFGCPTAMKHWDIFYRTLTKDFGLSPKPVLEGLSRGGLYIYNWAAKHPHDVSVLYGDNPVCDIKSWPGGKGHGPGSPADWQKLQLDYGFPSEQAALKYRLNPIDHLKPLADAGVPIIHCAADADEIVPFEENTGILKRRYEQLGGKIQVIVKRGFHHHPHGLDDPTPLVDFILAHTSH